MTATPSRSSPVPGLSIREAASRLGASVHTLRYYAREGLLSVPRLDSAQRCYSPADLELLRFLLALRATGMPMVLLRLGEATVSEQRDLLPEHGRAVVARIAALQGNLSAIEHKTEKYDRMGGCAPRGAN